MWILCMLRFFTIWQHGSRGQILQPLQHLLCFLCYIFFIFFKLINIWNTIICISFYLDYNNMCSLVNILVLSFCFGSRVKNSLKQFMKFSNLYFNCLFGVPIHPSIRIPAKRTLMPQLPMVRSTKVINVVINVRKKS